MAKKVGIPRSLFYYKYFPLWKTFFEELGAEITVSEHTSKKILDSGVKSCVEEACLPIKLFYGHVLNLKDRVDYLFIPRFTSISKDEYVCPKFGGLPDMIRHTVKDLPLIIDTEINLRKSKQNELKAVLEIGSYFSEDRREIEKAYRKALGSYRSFKDQMQKGMLAGDLIDGKKEYKKIDRKDALNIAVIGHVYNLYDSYTNMDMLRKLRDEGINVLTVDMIDNHIINDKVKVLPKQFFWNFGRKAVGGTMHMLERKDIDGIIYVMTFGCGVDSFVCDLVERRVRRETDIPFTVLTIDEHSGEAGMNTRLEAFTDMIRWRKKDENNISAHG